MPLIGPPPDPREVLLDLGPVQAPGAWTTCVLAGLALVGAAALARRLPEGLRWFLGILGAVVLLTMPLAGVLDTAVYGAWPGIDKEGSFLFYQDGVHVRALLHPVASLGDPALRLIGVHTGHLWVTHALDLLFTAHGAFNAQALLYPALAWCCAALLLRETGSGRDEALILGFPFGMGLHVFRDLTWSTVEKAAVFGVPLFLWALLRASRRGGRWHLVAAGAFFLGAWINVYVGLLNGILALLYLASVRNSRSLVAVGASLAAGLPLALWQSLLFRDAGALADPQRYLWERAAFDVLSLWPPAWYRMEAWRAFNLVAFGLAAWGWTRDRSWRGLAALVVLTILSMGPWLCDGVYNPFFLATWKVVPGFWRLAKPEFLFEGAYLLVLVQAGIALTRLRLSRRALVAVGLAFGVAWVLSVRTHPAYPGFTEPVPVKLAPGWAERVFGE